MGHLRCLILAIALPATAGATVMDLPLAAGWSAYGGEYGKPQVLVVDGVVTVSGLARASSPQWGHIATLPTAARPEKRMVFTVNNHGNTTRVDVLRDGRLMWVAGGTDSGWLSLDGIRFAQQEGQRLAAGPGWRSWSEVNDIGMYKLLSASKHGNRVLLSGLLLRQDGNIAAGQLLTTLPAGLRPAQPQLFSANTHSKVIRVDVHPDGRVVLGNGAHDDNWISLDGIEVDLGTPTALTPINGWAVYGGFGVPAASVGDGVVTLSGLFRRGPSDQPMAQLPAGTRPARRHIFHSGSEQWSFRVDITPDGLIHFITGPGTDWLSLAGISFPVGSVDAAAPVAATGSPTAGGTATFAAQRLDLAGGWSEFGNGYAPPSVRMGDGIVTVGGMASGPASPWGHIATLPPAARPSQRRIFAVNHHDTQARVDVLPDGRILWIAGGQGGWLSLEGIRFAPQPGLPLTPAASWRNYGGQFAPVTVTRRGDRVILGGLLYPKAGLQPGVLTTLPAGVRPAHGRLAFTTSGHSRVQRVDVLADGQVLLGAGGNDHNWVSLDGVEFSLAAGQRLSGRNGWLGGHGYGYADLRAVLADGLVTLSGNWRRMGTSSLELDQLPAGLRPAQRRVFQAGHDQHPMRIDVRADGVIQKVTGPNTDWISLANIAFPVGGPVSAGGAVAGGGGSGPTWLQSLIDVVQTEMGADYPGIRADAFLPALPSWGAKLQVGLTRHDGPPEYWQLDATVGDQPFTVVVYRPPDKDPSDGKQEKPLIAVLADHFRGSHVLADLKGTGIGDLEIDHALYIYMPMPRNGRPRTYAPAELPPPVRAQLAESYETPPPPAVTLMPGQNAWGLLDTDDAENRANEVVTVLTDTTLGIIHQSNPISPRLKVGQIRVRGVMGRMKQKNEHSGQIETTKRRVLQMVREGTWDGPFLLSGMHVTDASVEYSQWDGGGKKDKRIRVWGDYRVEGKDYFLYGQYTKGSSSGKGWAFALDSESLSYRDVFDYASHFGRLVLSETGDRLSVDQTGAILEGLRHISTALDHVRIEKAGKFCLDEPYSCTDEYNVPQLDGMLVTMASPKEVLPQDADPVDPDKEDRGRKGELIIVNGRGTVFGVSVATVNARVDRQGMHGQATLDVVPDWGLLELSRLNMALRPVSGGHSLSLAGPGAVSDLFDQSITLEAVSSGFRFAIPGRCPLVPEVSATIPGFDLTSGGLYSGILDVDFGDCLGDIVNEAREQVRRVADAVTPVATDALDNMTFGGKARDWFRNNNIPTDAWEHMLPPVPKPPSAEDAWEWATGWARSVQPHARPAPYEYPGLPAGTGGRECAEKGMVEYFLWEGKCRYNYAFHKQKVTQSSVEERIDIDFGGGGFGGGMSVSYDVKRGNPYNATDGARNTYTWTRVGPSPWWEVDLEGRVWVEDLVILGEYLDGAIVALSESVRDDDLMLNTSGAVQRFELSGRNVNVVKPRTYAQHIRIFHPGNRQLMFTEVAVLSTEGNCPNRWVQLPGNGVELAVSRDYALIANRTGEMYLWNKDRRQWNRFSSGLLDRISLDGSQYVWGANRGGDLYRWQSSLVHVLSGGSNVAWFDQFFEKLPGSDGYSTFTANNQSYAVTATGLFRWVETEGAWAREQIPFAIMEADGHTARDEIWAVAWDNQIWRRLNGSWSRMDGRAWDIAVGDYVWVVGMDHGAWVFKASDSSWRRMPGGGHRIAVGVDGYPWIANHNGDSMWVWCQGANNNRAGAICGDAQSLPGAVSVGWDGNEVLW